MNTDSSISSIEFKRVLLKAKDKYHDFLLICHLIVLFSSLQEDSPQFWSSIEIERSDCHLLID